jgi:DNA polymerase elongation subunit (family B)
MSSILDDEHDGKATAPRMLCYDIETSPSTVHTFSMWSTNIDAGKVIVPSSMMCFAAQWVGEDEVIFRSTFHDGRQAMVEKLHRLFDEADVLIGYNHIGFDNKHSRREFVLAGLPPPSPSKNLDLMRAVKAQFAFTHNGLDNVCQQLGLSRKQPHEGFDLWVRCVNGDPEAWEIFRAYCENDTKITMQLYHRLLPWLPHPNIGAYTGEDVCVNCGSARLQRRGHTVTTTGRFPRLHCQNCGRWQRATKREAGTGVTSIAA